MSSPRFSIVGLILFCNIAGVLLWANFWPRVEQPEDWEYAWEWASTDPIGGEGPPIEELKKTSRLLEVWKSYGWPMLAYRTPRFIFEESSFNLLGIAVNGLVFVFASVLAVALRKALARVEKLASRGLTYVGQDDPSMRFSLRSLVLLTSLITCGVGLWYRWAPWYRGESIQQRSSNIDYLLFDVDGREVFGLEGWEGRASVWKWPTCEYIGQRNLDWDEQIKLKCFKSSPDGRRALSLDGVAMWGDLAVHDNYTDTFLSQVVPDDGSHEFFFAFFSPDAEAILLACGTCFEIYHRRRPEWWWGVAWLPEFWLTVVLGIGLVVSLWRDSRIMRA